jgi:hypothetical protein
VQQVTTEELKNAADAILLSFAELKILQHIKVEMNDTFGFIPSVGMLALGEEAREGEKPIRDALHRGDNDDDVRGLDCRADEIGGVQHALGSKQGAASKFQRNDLFGGLVEAFCVCNRQAVFFIRDRKAVN